MCADDGWRVRTHVNTALGTDGQKMDERMDERTDEHFDRHTVRQTVGVYDLVMKCIMA